MRRILLAPLLLLLAPAICWAVPFVQDLPPGVHYQKVTVAADGSVTAERMPLVVPGGPSPKPPPVDPDDPVDPDPFVEEVRKLTAAALTAGGSKTTGAALSAVYSLVGQGVTDGDIAAGAAFTAVKAATDVVLAGQADKDKWTKWRTDIATALNTLQGQGLLTTKEQIAGVLGDISKGLDKATGNTLEPRAVAKIKPADAWAFDTRDGKADGVLDGIDLAKLIELIKLVLELLKLFGLGV